MLFTRKVWITFVFEKQIKIFHATKLALIKMHEYFSTEKFLCSSLKKIIFGLPHLFSKVLRKAFLKD